MKTLIYLHGYNSSPQSHKALLTTEFMGKYHPSVKCLVPQLSFAPAKAVAQVTALMDKLDDPVIIGSSLGGYYANFFVEQYACKAVLVNPAVYPDRLLKAYLGPQSNDYTGETYTLTLQHMIELQALAITTMAEPNNRLLMVQTADETLDFSEATHCYRASRSIIEYGGDHSFIGYDQWLPVIADFLALP